LLHGTARGRPSRAIGRSRPRYHRSLKVVGTRRDLARGLLAAVHSVQIPRGALANRGRHPAFARVGISACLQQHRAAGTRSLLNPDRVGVCRAYPPDARATR
jgi:hypothetical protein